MLMLRLMVVTGEVAVGEREAGKKESWRWDDDYDDDEWKLWWRGEMGAEVMALDEDYDEGV